DASADAALLRVLLHRGNLAVDRLRFAALADQLVDRRHEVLFTFLSERAKLPVRGHLIRAGTGFHFARRGSVAPRDRVRARGSGAAAGRSRGMPHEPETLHPRRTAPGYFDGCPARAPLRIEVGSNRERPCEARQGPRDITGNVQLYLPEARRV